MAATPIPVWEAMQGTTHILSKDTPAFEDRGLLSRLPCGAELEVIGEGFSDGTIRVRSNGLTYFIFLRDLEEGADYPASLYR